MRVLNKKYWPASVQIDYDYRREDEIWWWCKENLKGFVIVGSRTYYFKDEQDATLFSLRWS
jgi:hypothetical protein